METITRIFEFDAAHRILNEKIKCFNLHGHRFKVEVTFKYDSKGSLGYAVDFKELKRIAGDWIDTHFDHAAILNPKDTEVIELCRRNSLRLYVMGFGRDEDINPSAENLASELFTTLRMLFREHPMIEIAKVRLYETPNCWVETDSDGYMPLLEAMDILVQASVKYGIKNYDRRSDNA